MKSCISQCTIKNNGNWTKTELNLRVFMKFQLHFIPPVQNVFGNGYSGYPVFYFQHRKGHFNRTGPQLARD